MTTGNCTCALREREKDTIADKDIESSPPKMCVRDRRLVEPKSLVLLFEAVICRKLERSALIGLVFLVLLPTYSFS